MKPHTDKQMTRERRRSTAVQPDPRGQIITTASQNALNQSGSAWIPSRPHWASCILASFTGFQINGASKTMSKKMIKASRLVGKEWITACSKSDRHIYENLITVRHLRFSKNLSRCFLVHLFSHVFVCVSVSYPEQGKAKRGCYLCKQWIAVQAFDFTH